MTSFSSLSRNTTTYDEALALGRLTYLVTDEPCFILVGSASDETLILWEDTAFSTSSRNTTTFTAVARN